MIYFFKLKNRRFFTELSYKKIAVIKLYQDISSNIAKAVLNRRKIEIFNIKALLQIYYF